MSANNTALLQVPAPQVFLFTLPVSATKMETVMKLTKFLLLPINIYRKVARYTESQTYNFCSFTIRARK